MAEIIEPYKRPTAAYKVLTKQGSEVDVARHLLDYVWCYLFAEPAYDPDNVPEKYQLNTLLVDDISERFMHWIQATPENASLAVLPLLNQRGFWPTLSSDKTRPDFSQWDKSFDKGAIWYAKDQNEAFDTIAKAYQSKFGALVDEIQFRYPWHRLPRNLPNTLRILELPDDTPSQPPSDQATS